MLKTCLNIVVFSFACDAENPYIVEVTRSTGWGTASDWVGAAAGNFVSGGYEEFIAVRNNPKQILVYKFNGTAIQYVYSNALNLPTNASIAAVASGNLDSDDKDEIVILVNSPYSSSNGYYVYDINDNGVLSQIATWTGWGSASDWKGLAVGDVDADGIEYFPVDQTEGNVLGAGNLDNSSINDELIVLRNSDGGMVAFAHTEPVEQIPASSAKSTNVLSNVNDIFHSLDINETNPNDLINSLPNALSDARIYPNPTTGIIKIDCSLALDKAVNYRVLNSVGQVVRSGILKSNLTKVDISNEIDGFYLIQLNTNIQLTSFKLFLSI